MKRPASSEPTVSREVARRPRRPTRDATLRFVHPSEIATSITVGRDPIVLGRDPGEGTPAIEHPTVSRRHFSVEWDATEGTHVGSDLGSRNGSSIDEEPLTGRSPLRDGAVLRLGDVVGIYELSRGNPVGDAPGVSREQIPGEASATRALRSAVARAAADPSPVLLVGETGTGKEHIAQEVHRLSGRPGPLLAVNCSALAAQLVESQLFGHAKGAFTGATTAQPGLFRAAQGGSIFLDEIGELAADLQPKLLRAIQEREIQPVGGTGVVKVDVRVIAATNRDLSSLARTGGFRRDLYARLSLWEIRVPPLRDRRADVLLWLERLHARWLQQRAGKTVAPLRLDADAVELLLGHDLPLNLRDLDRLVHALSSIDERPVRRATLRDLLEEGEEDPSSTSPPGEPRRRAAPTREELEEAFRETNGNVRALARRFGRDRRQIYRWMEAFGLKRGD